MFKEAYSYTMPRTAYTQGYNNFGRKINSMSELKRGDLVFFNTNKNDSDRCDHVGIYMGKNQFIHASSTEGKIVISDISKRWWAEIFSWGKRVIE
ncbi:MAG: NlpC/P60 family protein [Oscillospiraceae bacterium]|nr:MAG: NlpC/P60 family protein [Oscillospiraceae bacterium]